MNKNEKEIIIKNKLIFYVVRFDIIDIVNGCATYYTTVSDLYAHNIMSKTYKNEVFSVIFHCGFVLKTPPTHNLVNMTMNCFIQFR